LFYVIYPENIIFVRGPAKHRLRTQKYHK